MVGPRPQIDGRGAQRSVPELLLKISNVDPGVQCPAAETVPENVRRDPLPLPHLAGPSLLEACILRHIFQEPLDLPRGEMLHISPLKDVPASPALQVYAERVEGRPGDDAGALLSALAFHHVQVSAGAVQVLYLHGCNLGDAKATASHEPEEGGLSRGGGCGEEAVPDELPSYLTMADISRHGAQSI